jgi:hypothetical protein
MSTRTLTIALTLTGCIGLAGCASQAVAAGPHASSGVGSASASPATASPGATGESPKTIATRDAARILGTFRPPAGAHRLTGPPVGAALVSDTATTPGSIDLVRDTQWWTVAGGGAETILAHLAVPSGASRGSSMSSGSPAGSAYATVFTWPVITGVLADRWLEVSAATVDGRTVMRVDAMVLWLPPRPANTFIPTTTTEVTVVFQPGSLGLSPQKPLAPVTSTDPAKVAAIVDALNKAPILPPGEAARPCPADTGVSVNVTFLRAGRIVATADVDPAGCGNVTVTVVGGGTVTLIGGFDLATRIESLLGQHWPL